MGSAVLKRLLLAMVLAVGLGICAVPAAQASCTSVYDPNTGQYKLVCTDGGGDGGGDNNDGGGAGETSGTEVCMHAGAVIPCSYGGGRWNGECWVTGRIQPQPAPPDGKAPEGGVWYHCIRPLGAGAPGVVWVENGAPLINPITLAYRAIAAMDLDPITIGIVPESAQDRVGLVGLPVWMWVDDQREDTWGPITRSASEGPVSVSATASASSVVWDMGDGTKVTCSGPGTPYADRYGKQASPTCGHRYTKMSSGQPGGAYQVTAISHWVIEWAGGGQSGTIEVDLATAPLPIRVGEAQVLTQ